MKKKSSEPTEKTRRVKFSIVDDGFSEVILMGDFNNWDPKLHPMKSDGNGSWSRTLMIPPGKYEYKFLIDGHWQEDPVNQQTCPNCFGTVNSVVELS